MGFSRWYPLAEAGAHAPPTAGVFQVRLAEGLRRYPRGASAMVHYQLAADVRAEAEAFARQHADAPWWCRHLEDGEDPTTTFARVHADFVARFGAPPSWDPA